MDPREMEHHISKDEIDDITCAVELSLLDLNYQNGHFVAKDHASSSNDYLNGDEDEELAKAIEESLKPPKLHHHRRKGKGGTLQNGPVCDVCDQSIKAAFGKREFWNQIFCRSHLFDGTSVCCGCMRLKSREAEYVGLGDGREICSDCYPTAILDGRKCKPLIGTCHEFFKRMNMEVRKDIPLFLVDRHEMTRLTSQGLSTGPVHPNTTVWGLTMVEARRVETVRNTLSRGNKIRVVKQTQDQLHGCGITIAVLFGLPKVITGAILAHEMMHAWLRLQGVGSLKPKVEEGICQVIAHRWLDWFEAEHATASTTTAGGGGEQAQFVRNLIETFKHEVEMDSSRAYGEGFRDAQWAVAKYGLEMTIDYIVTHKNLPKK